MAIPSRFGIAVAIVAIHGCASLKSAYQRDADLFRISHLIHYGELLREYHGKTGHYPFQDGSGSQASITFVTQEQRQYLQFAPEESDTHSMEQFRSELSRTLGRDIELKFDPQRVPTTMPLYYLYAIDDGHYFFAFHLYNDFAFTTNRGPGFNHIEITDSGFEHEGFWEYEELIRDLEFRQVASKIPGRAAWFLELEERNK